MANAPIATGTVEIVGDASKLEATVAGAKGSVKDLGVEAGRAGEAAAAGLKKIEPAADAAARGVKRTGDAARETAKGVDEATKATDGLSAAQRRVVETAQRMALSEEGGTRAVLEHKAARLGMTDAIAPYVARMDAAKASTLAEVAAQRQASDSSAFLSSLAARANAIGKTTSQVLELRAAELGLSSQSAPYIAKLRETEAAFTKTGVSAAQTAAAMRMVPAQMTDVVTQLAGGQNPLLIAIQQGGQLKDSFGGIGPMFAALGKMITPMVVGLTAAAGAVALLAYGFTSGASESEKLRAAVIATGRVAGVTAGQIQDLAGRLGDATGQYGDARDAAQALAASGKVVGQQLEVAMRGTLDGIRVTGRSVQELVGDFEKLGGSPTKAVAELNEKYHFLTASVFAQIQALEQQGRTTDAATLAQRTYADALASRRGEIVQNIGYIERGWLAVKSAMGGAIDAIASVGRDDSMADTIRKQIDEVNKLQEQYAIKKEKGDGRAAETLKKLISARGALMKMQEESAAAWQTAADKGAAQRLQDAGVAAVGWIKNETLAIDKEAASRQKATEAVERYTRAKQALDADPNPNGKEAKELRQMLAGVTFGQDGKATGGGQLGKLLDEYKKQSIDKGAVSSAASAAQNALQGRIAAIEALAKAEQDALKNQQDQQKKLLDAGAITLRQYYDTSYDLRADSLQKQLRIAQQEEAEATGLKSAAAREKAKAKTAEIQRDIEANAQTHADNLKSIGDKFQTSVNQQTAKWANSQRGMQDALASENAMYGKSADAREIAAAGMKVEQEARTLLMEEAKKLGPLTEEQTNLVNDQAKAYGENARQITANTLAAKGASQLLGENRRFQADSILDEKQRAAAILEIDADVWRERISNAAEGSQERQRLEEQFGVWYSNQTMKPTIDRWKEAANDLGQDAKTAWLSITTDPESKGLVKTFTKGIGASLKTQLMSAVYDTFMKKYVVQAMIGVAGLVGGPGVANALSGQGAGGGVTDSLGTAKQALDFGNGAMQAYGGFSTGASTASMGYANAVQVAGGDGLGALIAGNGSWAGVPVASSGASSALGAGGAALGAGSAAFAAGSQAAGAYVVGSAAAPTIGALVGGGAVGGGAAAGGLASTLGGAMSAIGAAMPYIGLAIAAYTLLSGSFKGEKRSGGTFNYQDGQAAFLHGPSGGTDGKEGVVTNAMTATADGVNSILKGVGSALSVSSLIAGFEGSEKGRGGVMSGITLSNGMKVGEDGSGSNYKGTYYETNSPQTLTTEAAAALLATDLKQVQIQALQAAEDLPAALKKLIDGIEAESLSDEAVTGLLAKIQAQVTGVTQFTAFVDGFDGPFDKLKGLTYDLKTSLIDAAGGVEPLTANLASYYENFTSEADRMENTFNSMKKKIESVGQVMPKTEAEFKALTDQLVNGLGETDTEGQKAAATMLSLNGTFKSWAEYSTTAAEATRVRNKEIADQQKADVVKAFETQLGAVQQMAQRASALLTSRNAAGSTVDTIDKALGGTAAFAARREQELWAAMQTASLEQQVALSGELTGIVLDRYQTEKANLQSLVDLGKSLRTYVQGLKVSDLSPLTLGEKLAEGAKQYQDTLAKAQGGDQAALQALQGVSQTYLELQRRYSASGADYTTVFDSVTGALDGLGLSTQTAAEQQLITGTAAVDQLNQLRGIADGAQKTLDRQYQQAIAASKAEMAGLERIALETGRLGEVTSLLTGLPAELAAALQPLLSTSSKVSDWYQGTLGRDADAGGLDWWSKAAQNGATQSDFTSVAQRELALNAAYQKLLGRLPDAAGRDFWLSSGLTADQFESAIGKSQKLPGYAKGGLASGMALVGELGPEVVDFRSPARVYTNDQLSSAIRGGSGGNSMRLERLVEGLVSEVIKLKAALVEATGEGADRVAATVAASADHVANSVGKSVTDTSFETSQRRAKIA